METLWAWPTRQRMPNMLLIGATNNGKSMIIERFHRNHHPTNGPLGAQVPVLGVQMPPEPSPLRFYAGLQTALGAPALPPHIRLARLEQSTLALLGQAQVRMLIIDELHNVLAGPTATRREFLNLLRFIGNQLRIPIVGVGTRQAYLAIRSDDQLENRFEPLALPIWEPDGQARSLLASFAASFPLRQPSIIAGQDMTEYLLARSEGTIGELAQLLTAAAIAAVDSGTESINEATLTAADYHGPTERRRIFERELR